MNGKRLLFPKWLVILFFFGYFVFGLSLVDDYGIHWDDHSQHLNGLVTADYINEFCGGCLTDKSLSGIRLEDYSNRTHGVVFQEAALGVQYLLGITDARGIFLLRHYLTFIVFFIGLIFFYHILKSRYNNRALAMLGILFMILSPRIFADSFYNSKDIVFLSLTIISTWTLIRFLQNPTFSSATWHALICALLISTRITGVFVPALTLFFLILNHFWLKEELKTGIQVKAAGFLAGLRFVLIKSGYYLFMMFLFTVVFWPYLWSDPLRHFIEIFTTMSHFNWDDPVLFRGSYISPASLPFYYVPYWIAITTPVLYSFLFLAGLGFIVFLSRRNFSGMIDYIILSMLFFPLLAVILLGSVIYDGWRQLFFLYVPFLIISIKGLAGIFNFIDQKVRPDLVKWSKWSLYLIIFISCGSTAAFMVRNHPYQNVYFNFQAGAETTKDFEADYWGLSYRQVLQYLLDNDQSDTIKILSVNWPGKANADIFPKPQRDRLKFTSPGEAHYYISNYRFPTEHTMLMNLEYPYNQPVFEIKVRGNRIAGAYLLNR